MTWIYQLAESFELKSAFNIFGMQSVAKTFGIYQLFQFVVLKSVFIKCLMKKILFIHIWPLKKSLFQFFYSLTQF